MPAPKPEKEIPVTATIESDDHEAFVLRLGKVVANRGKVHDVGKTRSGSMQFINFTGNQRGRFVGIVKRENLEAVTEALGGDPKSVLTGKDIELRGEIVLYKGVPEIVVTSADQIRVRE